MYDLGELESRLDWSSLPQPLEDESCSFKGFGRGGLEPSSYRQLCGKEGIEHLNDITNNEDVCQSMYIKNNKQFDMDSDKYRIILEECNILGW